MTDQSLTDAAEAIEQSKDMPWHAVNALVAIAKIADQFKADDISATRFTLLVGAELTKLLQDAGAIY